MYHQVWLSKILRFVHSVFVSFVRISDKTPITVFFFAQR